eukprot:GEMP01085180.1.p1 GENE.GEMP01085180.1~~GEMP01085180.1.p1  ORF type:complete len:149 (+),score=33.21 GEMP01085180.1:57-503(+)
MVCGAMALGDFLAYASIYQPGVLLPLVTGKLIGGACGISVAKVLVLPLREGVDGARGSLRESLVSLDDMVDDSEGAGRGTVRLFNPRVSKIAFESFDSQANRIWEKLAELPAADSRHLLDRMEGAIAQRSRALKISGSAEAPPVRQDV